MCGRFYIDDDTAKEIQKLLEKLDARLQNNPAGSRGKNAYHDKEIIKTGEIYPTNVVPIVTANYDQMILEPSVWGLQGINPKVPVINARAETIMEKSLFKESFLTRRCMIMASGFYEWDKSKNKLYFQDRNEKSIYMAGIYHLDGTENRFAIITTQANESMKQYHDRMPLILRKEQVTQWLFQKDAVEELLNSVPPSLKKNAEYEQARLEFL